MINAKAKIAKHFGIGFHEVFIVGSAKLGFSYHKNKDFDYNSDVDVVIVNEKLFDDYYDKICDYQYKLDKNTENVSLDELDKYSSFLQYLVKGWMRPDKLPISFQAYILKKEWFDFFNSISNNKSEVGDYQVKTAIRDPLLCPRRVYRAGYSRVRLELQKWQE